MKFMGWSSGVRPWLVAAIFLLVSPLAGAGPDSAIREAKQPPALQLTQSERDWIQAHPEVVFTGDPNWLPYEAFRPDGSYVGMVSDYLKVIERRTGLRFQPIPVSNWSESLQIASQGKVSVISGDAADAVLNQGFRPVDAYSRNPIVIVMDHRQHFVERLEQIADRRIAIIDGYGYTADIFRRYPDIDFIEVENIQQGLEGVAQGRLDALLATMALASYHIAEMGVHNVKIVGKTPIIMDLTLFVAKDLPVLHSIIDKTLKSISQAQSQDILRKWIRSRYVEKTDYWLALKLSAALLLVLGVILFWNRRLTREVKRRKQTEHDLLDSRRLLRQVIDEIPDILVLKDHAGDFLLCNQAVARLYDTTPEAMVGKSDEDFGVPKDMADFFRRNVLQVMASGKTETVLEDSRDSVSGEVRHYKSIKKRFKDAQGNDQVLVIAHDITDIIHAQRELTLSEEKYRRLVDNLSEEYFFYKHDADGVFTYVSPSVTKMLGWEPDEFRVHYSEHTADHSANAQVAAKTELGLQGIRQPPYQVVTRHKDGSERWLEITEIPIFDHQGKVLELEGFAHDFTARKQAEDQLRLQALVLDQIQDHVTVTDLDGKVLYVNQAEVDGVGRPKEQILGRHVSAYGDSELADASQDEVVSQTMSQGNWQGRVVNFRADGTPFHLDLRTTLVHDEEGKPLALVGVGTDISERMRAEQALRDSERQLLEAQQIAHIGHWELDVASGEAKWSRELHHIMGTDPAQPAGPRVLAKLIDPDDWPAVQSALSALVEDNAPYDLEYRIRRSDGTHRWLHSRARCHRDDAGNPVKLIGIAHDITERKQAEILLQESEARFRRLFEHTDAIAVQGYDAERRVIYWNPASEALYGYPAAEAMGRALEDLIIPDAVVDQVRADVDAWVQGGPAVPSAELVLRKADGSPAHVFSSHVMLRGPDDKPQMYCIDVDLSRLKQAEKQVRLLSQVVEQSPVSVVITDTDGVIEYVNRTFARISGYSTDEVVGRKASLLKSGKTPVSLYRELWQRITGGGEWQGEMLNRRKNGELFWEQAHISPVVDEHGVITNFLAVKEDISQRKAQEERILRQAHYDSLTGLPNRFLVLDRLEQLVTKAKRSQSMLAVLFLDLDDFKKINDSLGHDVGDRVLVEAGKRVSRAVRSGDTVGRLGGDEFIVLLDDIQRADDASRVAESVLDQFRVAFHVDGRELLTTTSIGIALFPDDGDTPLGLLSKADSAMYHSKELGRNTFAYFIDTLNRHIARRLELEEQLHGALERDEFHLLYQPKIALQSGELVGAEALIRWHSQALGQVPPAEFIPVAEQCGLILPIGRFVLTQALEKAGQWQKQRKRPLSMAINLSPRQFRDADLIGCIDKALGQSQIDPKTVELEITEGVLMDGYEWVESILADLKTRGLRLVMDDFGTGYSSLSYLRTYPFDVLKVDRSFVRDMTSDSADLELVNAAIAMGHGLGLEVVAEGVETQEQLGLLSEQQCDFAQGYFFGKPVTAEAFGQLLADWVPMKPI